MLRMRVKTSQFLKRPGLRQLLQGGRVLVGYTAPYAVYVHENTQMKLKGEARQNKNGAYWDAIAGQGSSKYLERPLRQLAGRGSLTAAVAKGVQMALRSGDDPAKEGLMAAGVLLQEESQKIVPYESGRLRKSTFIVYNSGTGAGTAWQHGEPALATFRQEIG